MQNTKYNVIILLYLTLYSPFIDSKLIDPYFNEKSILVQIEYLKIYRKKLQNKDNTTNTALLHFSTGPPHIIDK